MENIVLTELEQKVIKAQLAGTYSPFAASKEEGLAYNHVIELAMEACTNIEETGGDLLRWFWNKYQSQNGDAAQAETKEA